MILKCINKSRIRIVRMFLLCILLLTPQVIFSGQLCASELLSEQTSISLNLNLEQFKIIQKDNTSIKGTFVVKNPSEIQGEDLKYFMEIYKDNDLSDMVLVDTKSYPFNILGNQTKTIEFTYEMSDKIDTGVYHMIIKIVSEDGLPVGIILGDIGEIKRNPKDNIQVAFLTLKQDSVKFIKDNKELSSLSSLSYEINEAPKGTITLVNNSTEVIKCYPQITVYALENKDATIVQEKGGFETFQPNETKEVNIDIPAQTNGGVYLASVLMLNETDKVISSTCEFKFTVINNEVKILEIKLESIKNSLDTNIKVSVKGTNDKSEIKQAELLLNLYDENQLVEKSWEKLMDIGAEGKVTSFVVPNVVLINASKIEAIVQKNNRILSNSSILLSDNNLTSKDVSKDVENTKFKDAVSNLINGGIINGYPDGSFKPYKTITRAEFAKIICLTGNLHFDITKQETNNFKDVDKKHWAYEYITIAEQHKLIKGYPGGVFKGDNNVNYAEAITILIRMIGHKELEGKWPDNYLKAGKERGITTNVAIKNHFDRAIRGDIALMVWNTCGIKTSYKE